MLFIYIRSWPFQMLSSEKVEVRGRRGMDVDLIYSWEPGYETHVFVIGGGGVFISDVM